jgi:hypothetical protein
MQRTSDRCRIGWRLRTDRATMKDTYFSTKRPPLACDVAEPPCEGTRTTRWDGTSVSSCMSEAVQVKRLKLAVFHRAVMSMLTGSCPVRSESSLRSQQLCFSALTSTLSTHAGLFQSFGISRPGKTFFRDMVPEDRSAVKPIRMPSLADAYSARAQGFWCCCANSSHSFE